MYYVITDNEVHRFKRLKQLNKKLESKYFEEDFKRFGPDRIIQISKEDIDFKKDLAQLDQVAVSRLYKKDKTMTFLLINIVLTAFTMLQAISARSAASAVLQIVQKLGG